MSFIRANGTLEISDCPGAVATASGVGADDATGTTTVEAQTRDQIKELQRQLNRYRQDVPPAGSVPVFSTSLPVNGVLDANTMVRLQAVVLRRASAGGSTGLSYLPATQQAVLANAYLLTDYTYVFNHLPDALAIVSGYADSKGLPGPSASIIESIAQLPLPQKAAVVGVIAWFTWSVLGRGLR